MNLDKLLINPVRIMIMQYLTVNESATTSEIIGSLKNVSRATVYNHIKILEENELISVVQENQIRGTIEKTFSINKNNNHRSDYTSVSSYLLYLMVDFQNYFENLQNEMNKDMLFIDRSVMYLDDENFKKFFTEYEELCKKYFSFECKENNKGRTISLISSPFVEGEKA
ncbi:MAG: helix-turn-helix domain-containing protein [Lachnotalea sp.]